MKIMVVVDRHVKSSRDKLGAYYLAHNKIVETAKARGVVAVFDAGDSRVDCGASRYADACEMNSLILPLAKAGIGYYCIDGNHDRPGAAQHEITANSWIRSLKDKDLWKNVEYYNDTALRVYEFGGQKLQVIPLPYPPRHMFAAGKDLKTKQELDAAASEYIQAQLKAEEKKINVHLPTLILFHGTVDSQRLKTAGEARMPAGHDVNIPINAFPALKNVAVACGHIHMYQVLSETTPLVFYTGPLVPQEFDHEDLDTGVVILEFEAVAAGAIKHEFVPIQTVAYKTITIDLAANKNLDFEAEQKAGMPFVGNYVKDRIADPERTMLKFVIKAVDGQMVDKGAVRDALEAAGFNEPRIMVELPEAPAVKDMEKQIHDEIGSNAAGNLEAFVKEHPETMVILEEVGAGLQELTDAAAVIETEVFHEV